MAEDASIQEKLKHYDIQVQTVQEAAPIEVQPARVLSHLYTYLGSYGNVDAHFFSLNYHAAFFCTFVSGQNKKLKLSGRRSRDVGILSTSKLYSLHDRIFAFTPQVSLY